MMPSGFIFDPTRPLEDYQFNQNWANFFALGHPRVQTGVHDGPEKAPVVWANVNGWIIPLCGTGVSAEGDLRNIIKLYPPPQSNSRIDFVFLEAWQCRIDPNPSTVNKPSASTLWRFGNTRYGGTNLPDDLEDPTVGIMTTGRIQVQYRLRVYGDGYGAGHSVNLSMHPDGMDDPNILGQGTFATPVGGFQFINMREELGDPSLWRAGDGNPNNSLGTVDGFTYAIPICAIFRRNSNVYVAAMQAGNPNQNGSFNRTPGSGYLPDPLAGDRELTTATLTNFLSATAGAVSPGPDAVVEVTGLSGSGLEDSHHVLSSTFLVIDKEIVSISAVNLVNNTITIPAGGRGRYWSAAAGHLAGTSISFFNTRVDGLYADQIAKTDILDLRKAVNALDWDYSRLLEHNLLSLVQNKLRSTWKMSGMGDTQGATVHEVDYLYADSLSVPNMTEALDGPDGIRMVWSDAAVIQPDVTMLLDNDATQDNNMVGITTPTFDGTAKWDVGPDFHPSGFMNVAELPSPYVWTDGSIIFLYTGGEDGTEGARGTFRDGSTRAVRALFPPEYGKTIPEWTFNGKTAFPEGNEFPISIRFIGERAFEGYPADLNPSYQTRHPGPMFPWVTENFERPFIVLGSVLHSALKVTIPTSKLESSGGYGGAHLIDLGIDFNAEGTWYTRNTCPQSCNSIGDPGPVGCGDMCNDPKAITNPLNHGMRTLYGMLTANGMDIVGGASEVYVTIYGDNTKRANNGVFKVIGVGTAGYTTRMLDPTDLNGLTATATKIRVVPLFPPESDWIGFNNTTQKTVTVEFRAQLHNSYDDSMHSQNVSDVVIGLTDIGGLKEEATYPWRASILGRGTGDYDLSMPYVPLQAPVAAIPEKMLIGMTLLYHPGRGGMSRIPDEVERFALVGGETTTTIGAYLRQNRKSVDPQFPPMPASECYFDPNHVQVWNRLSSLGVFAPFAEYYGGEVVGANEVTREHELFIDRGSKTVIFRPFRDRMMTIRPMTFDGDHVFPPDHELEGGPFYATSGCAKDDMQVFTTGKKMGYVVPREFMPRFGRQDIPYWDDINDGDGPFLCGINHLFVDTTDLTNPIFKIIGGEPNLGVGPNVFSMFFITGANVDYGKLITAIDSINHRPMYVARRSTDIDSNRTYGPEVIAKFDSVQSSDFGAGLKGIQLPPYMGIARLYGVYTVDDFVSNHITFNADRTAMEALHTPNLLREDTDQQSLFIMQDGAQDLTLETEDHTYIIPSNVLDLTRAGGYSPGVKDKFEDFLYVVECTVFGFAKGFIDKNNIVLARKYDGAGNLVEDVPQSQIPVDPPTMELEGIHMVIPCPAGHNDQLYVAYNRTPYQGDPYMTRKGLSVVDSDYEERYGQLSTGAQYELHIPIQQYDANGNFVPQIPNAKAFEVLASMDFYTTMGTGKIGGKLFPGTSLDVCFTENSPMAALREPELVNSNAWRILPRTYTEGQNQLNSSRASIDLMFIDILQLNPTQESHGVVRFKKPDGTCVDIWASQPQFDNWLLYHSPYSVLPEDIFHVVETTGTYRLTAMYTNDQGILYPGWGGVPLIPHAFVFPPPVVNVPGAKVGDSVVLGLSKLSSGCLRPYFQLDGYVSAPDTVTLFIRNNFTPAPLDYLPTQTPQHYQVIFRNTLSEVGPLNHGEESVQTVDFDPILGYNAGFDGGFGVAVNERTTTMSDPTHKQAVITVRVVSDHQLEFIVHNVGPNPIPQSNFDLTTTFFSQTDVNSRAVFWGMPYDQPPLEVIVTVLGDLTGVDALQQTAQNLQHTVNHHPALAGWISALLLPDGDRFISWEAGEHGRDFAVDLWHTTNPFVSNVFQLRIPTLFGYPVVLRPTQSNFRGNFDLDLGLEGTLDLPINAGDGSCPVSLVGVTERLPLGALLQDSDFLCEDPLRDHVSAMKASPSNLHPIQNLLVPTMFGEENSLGPTAGGEEYTRFIGEAGSLVALSDGAPSVLTFAPYRRGVVPEGSRIFRQYRGGGPAFVLDGDKPGGPVDWVSGSFPAAMSPVLKGGILAGRALLVRNFYEEANPEGGPYTVSQGDEVQMVVMTYGILGDINTRREGETLYGLVSPSGWGEGFAAADRYRLGGHPMFRGSMRWVPDPADVQIAPYPDNPLVPEVPSCHPQGIPFIPPFIPPHPLS